MKTLQFEQFQGGARLVYTDGNESFTLSHASVVSNYYRFKRRKGITNVIGEQDAIAQMQAYNREHYSY